ncbi:MAG TPA: hypothetical protein VF490_03470 [Chryseosolibacter sp.]
MPKKNKTSQSEASGADGKSLQSSYVVTEHWMSDLQFFNEEITFLRNVINKYFLTLIEEKNIGSTRAVAADLSSIEKECADLRARVAGHLKHLAHRIENPFPYNAQEYQDEHARLEDAMTAMMKEFRVVKKEVFKVSEYAIDSEKSKHLLER